LSSNYKSECKVDKTENLQFLISNENLQDVYGIYATAEPMKKLSEGERGPDIHGTHFSTEENFKTRIVKESLHDLNF
jgi:hypothetical protein